MTKRAYGLALAALLALPLLAGCGSSKSSSSSSTAAAGGGSSTAPSTTASGSDSESGPETLKTARASMGTILVDGEGKTLYLFEKDRGTQSTCSGACARAWPPVTTDGAPKAGGGVTSAMLSTTKRSDGTTQVVYGGHPLYYFEGDSAAGDTRGQGIDGFGAEWYVVGPNGKKVEGHESGDEDSGKSS